MSHTIFTPIFHFLTNQFQKKQGKLWLFMLQVYITRSSECYLCSDFAFFSWILEKWDNFLEFILQVEYNLRCHVRSFLVFHFLMNWFQKNRVNSENSCYKWIIPVVPICHLYSDFSIFFKELWKNGANFSKLSSNWNISYWPATSNLVYPDFPFFSMIIVKRGSFWKVILQVEFILLTCLPFFFNKF